MREENLQLLKICEDRKVIQGARDALKSGRGGGLFYPRSQMTIGSVPVGFFRHRFQIFSVNIRHFVIIIKNQVNNHGFLLSN